MADTPLPDPPTDRPAIAAAPAALPAPGAVGRRRFLATAAGAGFVEAAALASQVGRTVSLDEIR